MFARWRYNRYVDFGFIAFNNFFESIHPQFLVIGGGPNPWHSLPGKGHLYWATFTLAILSILKLKTKVNSKFTFQKVDRYIVFKLILSMDNSKKTSGTTVYQQKY